MCVCGWGECWCVLVGVRVVVVSDAHVFWPLSCLFGFVFCLVNNGFLVVWARVGVCLWGFGLCGCVLCVFWGWLVVFAFVCGRVRVFCGRVKVCLSASCGLLGCCLCVGLAWCACGATGCCLACEGVWVLVSSGGRGCLGVGCVVAGGGLPVWLRGGVAQGGVSVGFDVGGRVFVLSGVGVPASCVAASGSGSGVGGVRVCVPCARAVFGDSWCSLVLRRWARAAGVDGAKVDALLGSGPASGSVPSSRVGGVSSGLLSSSPSPVSARGSASLRSPVGGGRVGAGFGARVRDWGGRVGVGVGVVSGGGVVSGWWRGVVGRVRALASGVGGWWLVLLGLVGVVVLVSVLVLVG